MKQNGIGLWTGALALGLVMGCEQTGAWTASDEPQDSVFAFAREEGDTVDRGDVERRIDAWPAGPKLAAYEMIEKYGSPQEATEHRLVWHNNGPWKRTVVTRRALPHDFPKLHMDYLEQTINLKVPADKADEIVAFDGSVTIDRTAGEISSRCDMEPANILTLNLAHDIINGTKSVEEARQEFGKTIVQFMLGEKPEYVAALQFQPPQQAADTDQPTIPGSPRRANDPTEALAVPRGERDDETREVPASEKGEAEVLAFLIAIDQGEIKAAANAAKEKIDPQVQRYASRLHQEHGKNLQKTMQLAQQIGVTPLQTAEVEKFINDHHAKLATLIQRDGEEFAEAYLDQMVKEHTKVLNMIDEKLMPKAQNAELKQHLQTTRQTVAAHLDEAKRLHDSVAQR